MAGIKIADGVLPWLTATKDIHNGHDGPEFAGLVKKLNVQDGFIRVTIQGIADLYGVHRNTASDWIKRYNKEHAKGNDRPLIQ